MKRYSISNSVQYSFTYTILLEQYSITTDKAGRLNESNEKLDDTRSRLRATAIVTACNKSASRQKKDEGEDEGEVD